MKTNTSLLPCYTPSPLKIIVKSHNKGWLRILKKEDAAIRQNTPVITNKSINDPNAWDASWFANYE